MTPGFLSDSAFVLSDLHNGYARAAVIAHWEMMPTDVKQQLLKDCAIFHEPHADLSGPVRTTLWGTTSFKKPGGRHLGVQDLVNNFDTDAVDSRGRKLGWTMALLEMLVDLCSCLGFPIGCRSSTNVGINFFARVRRKRKRHAGLKRLY